MNTVTLEFVSMPDGERLLPTEEAVALERFIIGRELEDLEDEGALEGGLGGLIDQAEQKLAAAVSEDEKRLMARAVAALHALRPDGRRAALLGRLQEVERAARDYQAMRQRLAGHIVTRAYRFEPYTSDQRTAARLDAERPDANGAIRFHEDIWRREIVRRSYTNLAELHGSADAGKLKAYLVDRLYFALERVSSPSLTDILFFAASLPTSATGTPSSSE